MTDFFANMINRHLGIAEVVEPRARARFEPESRIAAVDILADNFETEQSLARRKNRARQATEKSTEPGFNISDKKGRCNGPIIQEQPPTGLKPTVVPSREHRKADPPHAETFQQLMAQGMPPRASLAEEHQPPVERVHYEAPRGNTPIGVRPLNSKLDDRIDALLQRLDGRKAPQPSAIGAANSGQGSRSQPLDLDERNSTSKFHTPSVMPSHAGREEIGKLSKEQARNLPQEGRKPAAAENPQPAIPSIERNSRHTGLHELPPWLAQMQAEFNGRWQGMNSKSEAEPVLNVTIGRVEVRAVQAELPRQPKRKNKPMGVMSLDEYLNQRGRGGRT